jgi:hypothetical protein
VAGRTAGAPVGWRLIPYDSRGVRTVVSSPREKGWIPTEPEGHSRERALQFWNGVEFASVTYKHLSARCVFITPFSVPLNSLLPPTS